MTDFEKYTTKIIKAWLENTESYYNYYDARAAEILKANNRDKDNAAGELAEEIRQDLKNESPAGDTGLYADLIDEAIEDADIEEIAYSFLER